MRQFFIRFQILLASIFLLITFVMLGSLAARYNRRWDFTREKMFSLAEPTAEALAKMQPDPVEILAFYPHDDPAKGYFEMFLKQCALHHPGLKYQFYDPDRVPGLARQFQVKDFYTLIIQYQGRHEKILRPTEESFTNALVRLISPKKFQICFVTGHEEAAMDSSERGGLAQFRQGLENASYRFNEIVLSRDKVPDSCEVAVVAGPHYDLRPDERALLKSVFEGGRGVFLMLDPMDPGQGKTFQDFLEAFGVLLGEDVIVDKMTRVAGGDVLMPLVSRYVIGHPITKNFEEPTLYPVVRSVQPSIETLPGLEAVPLALSNSESWAETDLPAMEKGETAFEVGEDLAGPIAIGVALEKQGGGRMVVMGDSDFLTNAYISLSGNRAFGQRILQWLAKDDRTVVIAPRQPDFKPLYLDGFQRTVFLSVILAGFPALFFLISAVGVFWRRRSL